MRNFLAPTLLTILGLLAGCSGGGGSGGGTFVKLPVTGNANPTVTVTGMSGGGANYSLAVASASPLPGAISVTASDTNAGDTLQLSVAFDPSASSGFTDIPAQISVSPMPAGTPKTATSVATAPAQAVITLSPNGPLTQSGTLAFTVLVTDGQGGSATTHLSITVSATPANNPPALGAPTGPGAAGGASPSFTASLQVGASLAFSITATDPDAGNSLTVSASISGGSLTAVQAGFSTSFPASVVGTTPRTLSIAGTAANAGTINLVLAVNDGAGGSANATLAITITAAAGGSGSGGSGGAAPGNQTRVVNVSGLGNQSYYLYIPSSYNQSTPVPVLFALHGAGGAGTAPAAAQQARSDWATVAASEGFIVVAQAATGSGGGWVPGTDTTILNDIITDVFGAYNINTKRVYLWGFSAGAHYAHALALGNNTFFAAYGISAGALDALAGASAPSTAAATRRIPCDIHIGTSDSLLSYAQTDKSRFQTAGWTLGTNLYYTEFSGGHTYTTTHLGQIWANIKNHTLP
ncbi:MAG: hypothetical protein IPP14_08395 [Planctomycetes bacterium]|nr:hypothetical protein [Planctomycetota bacterium]